MDANTASREKRHTFMKGSLTVQISRVSQGVGRQGTSRRLALVGWSTWRWRTCWGLNHLLHSGVIYYVFRNPVKASLGERRSQDKLTVGLLAFRRKGMLCALI